PFDCERQGGTLAAARTWVYNARHDFGGRSFTSIAEGDIVVNSNLGCWEGWGHLGAAAQIWTHELGHNMGLLHSCADEATGPCNTFEKDDAIMRAFFHHDDRGGRLGTDDKAGIAYLYGRPFGAGDFHARSVSGDQVELAWRDFSDNETG